jgi:hypothetical protein
MAHAVIHAKSSAKKYGGTYEEYLHLHEWLDESKLWYPHSNHRMFRHHTMGIHEAEKKFGTHFTNSVEKVVYIRYILTDHIKEDCNNYVPTPKEWVDALQSHEKPLWMMKTMKLNFTD